MNFHPSTAKMDLLSVTPIVVQLARLYGILISILSRVKNTTSAKPHRRFLFDNRSTPDGSVGSFKGEAMYPLNDKETGSWIRLERTIDAFVARTPAQEYEFTPIISVEAYGLGTSRDTAQPTVLIGSTSRKSAVQLETTLRRSGVLGVAVVPFQVAIRDVEDETNVRLSDPAAP